MNIYRVRLLSRLCRTEMFAWAASIATNVGVYDLTRPAEGWTVDAVAVPEIGVLDLNPVFALPPGQGCRIVDARIGLKPAG